MHVCMNTHTYTHACMYEGGWNFYPLNCMIQKCLLACPPSQSDCEELCSLLGLYQGIFMYVCIWCHTRIFVTKQKRNTLTYTHIHIHIHTGVRVTKVKVEHMEDRFWIYRNDDDCFYYHSWRNNVVIAFGTLSSFYCLQDMNGKTGLDHLNSLKEIKALPNLDILSEYQKWVRKHLGGCSDWVE